MEYKIGLELSYEGKTGIVKFTDEDGILFESGNNQEFIPYSKLEGLEPVRTGEIVKLQKPNEESFTNTSPNNDGDIEGDCTVCKQKAVVVKDHICQTLLNIDLGNDDDYVPSFEEFQEARNIFKEFDQTQIDRMKKLWSFQHAKYHNNTFFVNIMKQLEEKKKLSQRQYEELQYLLDNGRSKYEAGVLTTKN